MLNVKWNIMHTHITYAYYIAIQYFVVVLYIFVNVVKHYQRRHEIGGRGMY